MAFTILLILAGLMGAGRTDVMETVFGLRRADAGCVKVHGRTVKINSPAAAIRHRFAAAGIGQGRRSDFHRAARSILRDRGGCSLRTLTGLAAGPRPMDLSFRR